MTTTTKARKAPAAAKAPATTKARRAPAAKARRAPALTEQQERAARLSAAANSAWATRRANGWVHPNTLAKAEADAAAAKAPAKARRAPAKAPAATKARAK